MWRYDPSGAVELCVLDHSEGGPGARWGKSVGVGEQVRLRKPEGTFTLRPDATHHVFVGEETASVAFAAMLDALPEGARVSGCVETEAADDRLPMAHSERLDWLTRAGLHSRTPCSTSRRSRAGSRTSPGRPVPCSRSGRCSYGSWAGTGGPC